jgi:hypothetical protein
MLWRNQIEVLITCINMKRFDVKLVGGASKPERGHDCSSSNSSSLHEEDVCHQSNPGEHKLLKTEQKNLCHELQDPEPNSPIHTVLGHTLTSSFHSQVLKELCNQLDLDECGEKGEFHTMVVSAPMFHGQRLQLRFVKENDGVEYAYLDLQEMSLVECGAQ